MNQLRYVTVKQMRELEDAAIIKHSIALSTLMENAGKAVAEEVRQMFKKGRIIVFAGYGNNGGDGMVAARYLAKNGYQVKVFLAGDLRTFSPETDSNYKALVDLGYEPQSISTVKEIDEVFSRRFLYQADSGSPSKKNGSGKDIGKPDAVVDAVFGLGIRGMLSDFYLKLIGKINGIGSPIISVDIPSGLEADTGEPLGIAVEASKTVTLGYPKVGFKNSKAKVYIGELVIADIGLPKID